MTPVAKSLTFAVLIALAGPVLAQTAEAPADATAEPAADPLALSMGEEAQPDGPKVGDIYIDSEHGDWDLRCVKSEGPVDPCQLYQLLEDTGGNPLAEINIFPLPKEQKAAAGATIITPLETLLTQEMGLSIDGSTAKKYPFSWCSQIGCFARIGLADADVAAFKRGVKATITIVPVAAANQKVEIEVSLTGFTAGFDAAIAKQPK